MIDAEFLYSISDRRIKALGSFFGCPRLLPGFLDLIPNFCGFILETFRQMFVDDGDAFVLLDLPIPNLSFDKVLDSGVIITFGIEVGFGGET